MRIFILLIRGQYIQYKCDQYLRQNISIEIKDVDEKDRTWRLHQYTD